MRQFDRYVCVGDSISWCVDGFDITARIEYDSDTRPDDYDCFDVNDPDHGEENKVIVDSWRNDEWFYCGVVLSVSRNDMLIDNHAASIWGVECNLPDSGNSYLGELAAELESEALESARRGADRMIAGLTS
jgi:hypothetical protein